MTRIPLDFKPHNTELDTIFFPVGLLDIYTVLPSKEKPFDIKIRGYKALVNESTNDVLSIVSNDYQLITNEQALEMGKAAFVKLFPSANEVDLIPFKVISSKRKSFCHIDLIHKNVKLSFNRSEWEQDSWYPYVRVTNSYNKMYALGFELGFVRAVCSNGVIFTKKTVKIKLNHTKSNFNIDIIPDITALKALEADFINNLFNLKRYYVERSKFSKVVEKALRINESIYRKKEVQYEKLKSKIFELSQSYANTEGENAYAVFNVITDLISNNSDLIIGYNLSPNSYYKKASEWMLDFAKSIEQRNFSMDTYLNE